MQVRFMLTLKKVKLLKTCATQTSVMLNIDILFKKYYLRINPEMGKPIRG